MLPVVAMVSFYLQANTAAQWSWWTKASASSCTRWRPRPSIPTRLCCHSNREFTASELVALPLPVSDWLSAWSAVVILAAPTCHQTLYLRILCVFWYWLNASCFRWICEQSRYTNSNCIHDPWPLWPMWPLDLDPVLANPTLSHNASLPSSVRHGYHICSCLSSLQN